MKSVETRIQSGITITETFEDHVYVNDGWEKGSRQETEEKKEVVMLGLSARLGTGIQEKSLVSPERKSPNAEGQFQPGTRIEAEAAVYNPELEQEIVEVPTEDEDHDSPFW